MEDCIFCSIVKGKSPAYTIYEDDDVMAFFDISIGNDFHTLIVPKKHYVNIYDIESNILKKVAEVSQKIALMYREKLGISDVNIVQSNGVLASQEVMHYHMHLLPRFVDDNVIFKFNVDMNNTKRLKKNFEKIKSIF